MKKIHYSILSLVLFLCLACQNRQKVSDPVAQENLQKSVSTQTANPHQNNEGTQTWKKTRSEKNPEGLGYAVQEFKLNGYSVLMVGENRSEDDASPAHLEIYYKAKTESTDIDDEQIFYLDDKDAQQFQILDSITDLQKDGKIDVVACSYSFGNGVLAKNYLIELAQGKARSIAQINSLECFEKGKEIKDLNSDGINEIIVKDIHYGGRFSGDWSEAQGLQIPLPEMVFEWDAKSGQYLLSTQLLKQKIPNPDQLAERVRRLRLAPQWKEGVVPAEALQQGLELMYAGQEAQGWKFIQDAAPQGSAIPEEVSSTLRRLRDKDPYWRALQSGKHPTLAELKF